jgi:hypothetical protein
VAYSWTKRIPRPEAGPGEYMATWVPLQTAAHWASENALLDMAARRGTPTRLVRYEDFVRSPRETLAGVLEFIGRPATSDVDPLAFVDGDELHLDPSHTVAGNPMRFATGTVRVVADDAWRTRLPAPSRAAVAALTAPLRRRYDYLGGSR